MLGAAALAAAAVAIVGAVSAAAAPPAGLILATLVPPNTSYTAFVSDPDGDELTYDWSQTEISCGTFLENVPGPGSAIWEHPEEQCPHDVGVFHEGTIVVDVSDGTGNTIRCTFEDSLPGIGPPCFELIGEQSPTTTDLASSPNPSAFGQQVTYTATVTDDVGTPTGEVTFRDGTTDLGMSVLDDAGVATLGVATLAVGTHEVTAEYLGDAGFQGSTSAPLQQTVNQAATTTTVSSSPNPSTFGQEVTFTANVAPQFAGTPTGSVTFRDGPLPLGTAALDDEGRASIVTTQLPTGLRQITAVYSGDASFTASDGSVFQDVQPAETQTALTSSGSPSTFGDPVTFTATVTSGAGTPSGVVKFRDGGTDLATVTLDGAGAATFTTAALGIGPHTITATYGGSETFLGSSGSLTHVVDPADEPAGTFNGLPRHDLPQPPFRNPAAAPGGVDLRSGAVTHTYAGPSAKGPCCEYAFALVYRSGLTFEGRAGRNWDFAWNDRVVEVNAGNLDEIRLGHGDAQVGDVVASDGTLRSDRYQATPSGFEAPPGFYTTLTRGSFVLRGRDGTVREYLHAGPDGIAPIASRTDRNGNRVEFAYDGERRLTEVRDPYGRPTRFEYDAAGRVTAVEDFAGRRTELAYDAAGDLVAITSPLGRTTRFTYSARHELLTVTRPNEVESGGPPALRYEYDALGRATRVELGGTNAGGVPSGGVATLDYGGGRTTVVDPNGNRSEHEFNALGNEVVTRRFTNRDLRPSEPDVYETRREFDADGELTRIVFPAGNAVEYTYDSANPHRRSQGNLLEVVRRPDGARGGDQELLRTTFAYEPVYNQVRTATDPRGHTTVVTYDYQEGNDLDGLAQVLGLPTAEVQQLLAASGVPMRLGNVNRDGRRDQIAGNGIRVEHPSVELGRPCNRPTAARPDCSPQARAGGGRTQKRVDLYAYNESGQLVEHRDPEGNRHELSYHPSPVAGGPSGYLRTAVADARRAEIRTDFSYDAVGNVTRVVDGRGVATDYAYDAENELVRVTRAAATGLRASDPAEPAPLTPFAYEQRFAYDANGNLVRHELEDRGATSGAGGFVHRRFSYDLLDNPVARRDEVAEGEELLTRYRYDPNGNLALTILPVGNALSAVFDERDLPFRATRGATAPPAQALLGTGDPTGYDVRGGPARAATYAYDANGNLREIVDTGRTTRFEYDGFDRRNGSIDAAGNRAAFDYDPAGNPVRELRFGPVGGPTPDGGTVDPVGANLLAATEWFYDEAGRPVQADRALFVNTTPTVRPPDVADGATGNGKLSLTPGDASRAIPGLPGAPELRGWVSTRMEYDERSLLTFVLEDDGDLTTFEYDGAGRLVRTTDAEGNVVDRALDDAGNAIEVRETDVAQRGGGRDRFVTTLFHDALGRLQRSVDSLGHTRDYRYDSLDRLVAQSDAVGPPGPVIEPRAFGGRARTTNGFGNVRRYSYDGLGRRVLEEAVLTASGAGDGVHVGADLFGVKGAIPTPDPAQGGGDGLATRRFEWDANSLLVRALDDNGNADAYAYDDVNRLVSVSRTPRTFEYDARGDLVRETDANGSVKTFTYDVLGRPVRVDVARGAGVGGTVLQTFEYDGLGRRTLATDGNEPGTPADDSRVAAAFDSLGRVLETAQQVGSSTAVVANAWRGENLRTALTYPDGRVVAYEHDGLDRVSRVTDGGELLSRFAYVGADRLLERRTGSGIRETIDYDRLGRPERIRHDGRRNALVDLVYDYDRAGRIVAETMRHDRDNSQVYEWDSLGRLVAFDRPDPDAVPPLNSTWKLDGVGNMLEVDGVPRAYDVFDSLVLLGGAAIGSDANGNLTDDGELAHRYDAWNRLIQSSPSAGGPPLVTSAFDAFGNRVQRTASPEEQFVLDLGDDPIYFVDFDAPRRLEPEPPLLGVGDGKQFVHAGGAPLAIDVGGQRFSFHLDASSSTAALGGADGSFAEFNFFDAYGNPALGPSPSGNPLLAGGSFFDDKTLLYGNGPVFTNPALGRSQQRDGTGNHDDAILGFLGVPYLPPGDALANEAEPSDPEELRRYQEARQALEWRAQAADRLFMAWLRQFGDPRWLGPRALERSVWWRPVDVYGDVWSAGRLHLPKITKWHTPRGTNMRIRGIRGIVAGLGSGNGSGLISGLNIPALGASPVGGDIPDELMWLVQPQGPAGPGTSPYTVPPLGPNRFDAQAARPRGSGPTISGVRGAERDDRNPPEGWVWNRVVYPELLPAAQNQESAPSTGGATSDGRVGIYGWEAIAGEQPAGSDTYTVPPIVPNPFDAQLVEICWPGTAPVADPFEASIEEVVVP